MRPILYISGSEALNFSDDEIEKLREFVEEGGMILGNADCGSEAFSKSFVNLGRKLFPKYEFRELPPTHIIFTDEQFKATKWKVQAEGAGPEQRRARADDPDPRRRPRPRLADPGGEDARGDVPARPEHLPCIVGKSDRTSASAATRTSSSPTPTSRPTDR